LLKLVGSSIVIGALAVGYFNKKDISAQ
jgi:hypothetical protein